MTLRERQAAFQVAMARLIDFCDDNEFRIVITELYRTKERQAELVKAGKSKTMSSYHLKGLAFDFVFLADLADGDVDSEFEDYRVVGEEWERLGGTWGGRWKNFPDPGHCEWRK